jgi:hypothetical protein
MSVPIAPAKESPLESSKGIVTPDSQDEISIDLQKEVYNSTAVDPVLAKKMALVNNAIDEIGMTPFQWKLFFLNGFGYAVDSVSLIFPITVSRISF